MHGNRTCRAGEFDPATWNGGIGILHFISPRPIEKQAREVLLKQNEVILELIKKLPFFEKFTADEKDDLARMSNHIFSYRANETIVRQGDFDPSLYILIKGRVFVSKNVRPRTKLGILKPGDVFGEIGFVKHSQRSANVIAETDAIVLRLDGKTFERMDPSVQNRFREKFLDILIDRLDNMNRQYLRDAKQ